MKISKLSLRNFRSHISTDFNFERLNIIRGRNGSGKSSLQMAIEYALTGCCDVTDAAGRGADALINFDQTYFVIKMELPPAVTLIRERRKNGGAALITDGKQEKKGADADEFIETTIAPLPFLGAVLNAGRFLEMKPAEQKALLASALAIEDARIPADLIALAEKIDVPVEPAVHCVNDLDFLHKNFYELRLHLGRELKAIGTPVLPEFAADAPTAEQILAKIDELHRERSIYVSKRAEKLDEFYRQRNLYESAKRQHDQWYGKILEEPELKRLKKVADKKPEAERLDGEISALQTAITANREKIVALREPQAAVCQACGQPLAVEDRAEKISEIEEKIAAEEKVLQETTAKRMKLGDPATAAQKIQEHMTAISRCGAVDLTVRKGEPAPADTSLDDSKLAELDEALRLANLALPDRRRIEDEVARIRTALALKAALAEKIDVAQKLIEAFGPDSKLRSEMIGGNLEPFRARIGEIMQRFGFGILFELEPYRLEVNPNATRDAADVWLNIAQLSQSEAYRFSIAFQIALAEATGVDLVIIDRADVLQPDVRRILTAELLSSRLDQAFVLTTGEHQEHIAYPEIPGVAFFELDNSDGTTKIARRIAAGAQQSQEQTHAN